jgi:hypothetical protein
MQDHADIPFTIIRVAEILSCPLSRRRVLIGLPTVKGRSRGLQGLAPWAEKGEAIPFDPEGIRTCASWAAGTTPLRDELDRIVFEIENSLESDPWL